VVQGFIEAFSQSDLSTKRRRRGDDEELKGGEAAPASSEEPESKRTRVGESGNMDFKSVRAIKKMRVRGFILI